VYGSNQSELAWTVIPLRTVFVLCLVTTRTIKAVQQAVPSAEALLVTIIGHQWWWEMRYPALGIVTANAWHVPVSDQTQPLPTFLKLQSVDVAHIPSLKAKELGKLPREEAGVW
jgi:cytochrome c oxidase subunit 2